MGLLTLDTVVDDGKNLQVTPGLPFEFGGSPAIIYGTPGCSKTAWVISYGVHCAAGVPFMGFDIREPMNVIYLDYDGNRIWRVARKFVQGYGLTFDMNRFQFSNPEEPPLTIGKARDETFINWIRDLIVGIRETTGLLKTIVILDAMNGLCTAVNENDAAIGQHLQNLTTLSQMDPECSTCVIVLHHKGKNSQSERGSSSIRCAASAMVEIKRHGSGREATYSLTVDKDRIAPKDGWQEVSFRFNDLAWNEHDQPISSVLELTTETATVASSTSTLHERILDTLSTSVGITSTAIARAIKKRLEDVCRALHDLEKDCLVERKTEGKSKLYYAMKVMS